jgi:ATP-dependent exoDNAse (exonuclease V) alpha subunit
MVIQFHQNVPGFRRGERVTVKTRDEHGVSVERMNGETAFVPLNQSARFQIYESRKIALSAGDIIRITQNGFTLDKRRLNNGDLKQVKGFTKDGNIKLANGWVLTKDYGNLTHGYCLTSHSSQSKGVDCVFVAESSESFRAAGREQFYVSASRFKEALTIYTDDKYQLLEAVRKSSHRPSATDLVQKDISESVNESAETQSQPMAVENCQRRISKKQKLNWPHKRNVHQSQSKGVGI